MELMDSFVIHALNQANPRFISAIGLDKAQASLWVEWEGTVPSQLESED